MAHARVAPRTHRDPPGAGVGGGAAIVPTRTAIRADAPRSASPPTRTAIHPARGWARRGGHRPHTHRDPRRWPTLCVAPHAPQTVQPAATAPRVPASGSAPRLCLLARARHPIGVHCTRSVQVYCSPSGALLPIGCTSVRARSPLSHSASHRVQFCPGVLLPIGCTSVRVLCFPSGALSPVGFTAPHQVYYPRASR